MKYITNANAIILILSSGETIRIEKTDDRYAKIINVFSLPKEDQEDAVKKIVNPLIAIEEKGFVITGDDVRYQGESLPKALVTKILSIVRDGLPVEHFQKFWERLEKNPSSESVNELIDFLSYKELPITEDGHFIAYRGVGSDYYSIHGNLETKVLQGTVDASGRILNSIGSTIEVRRRDVDDNRGNGCSQGLHVGSLDYAASWGPKVIVVKVDPADVVSVPKDCACQKCRVAKYEVLYDFVGEITSSVVREDGTDDLVDEVEEDNSTETRNEFLDKVDRYLTSKRDAGYSEVTIRQIQNSFSPIWPSKEAVLDAVQSLWYEINDDNNIVYLED